MCTLHVPNCVVNFRHKLTLIACCIPTECIHSLGNSPHLGGFTTRCVFMRGFINMHECLRACVYVT